MAGNGIKVVGYTRVSRVALKKTAAWLALRGDPATCASSPFDSPENRGTRARFSLRHG
jgi:hypothetical protein